MPDLSPVGLGAAGALALLIIDKTFSFVKAMRSKNGSNGASGDKSPDYWRLEFRQAIAEVLDQRMMPMMEEQQKTLGEIRDGVLNLITAVDRRSV